MDDSEGLRRPRQTESTDQNSGTFLNRQKNGMWSGQMSDA
jgi:hypothetical protein